MDYTHWIEQWLQPPGMRKPLWGRNYKLLGTLADNYADDRTWLRRQHFALTCNSEYLTRLGRIWGLPRWSYESQQDYRNRLVTAGYELEQRGGKAGFVQFMQGLFGAEAGGGWSSNAAGISTYMVGHSSIGQASVGGLDTLKIGVQPSKAWTVNSSTVGQEVIAGQLNTAVKTELLRFLDWYLASDIAYEVYYL